MPEIVNFNVALVWSPWKGGRNARISVAAERDLRVKDVREYVLKCAKGEDGTASDQEAIKILVEKAGVGIESFNNDRIEIVHPDKGTFEEKDLPDCSIVENTNVLFWHPDRIL